MAPARAAFASSLFIAALFGVACGEDHDDAEPFSARATVGTSGAAGKGRKGGAGGGGDRISAGRGGGGGANAGGQAGTPGVGPAQGGAGSGGTLQIGAGSGGTPQGGAGKGGSGGAVPGGAGSAGDAASAGMGQAVAGSAGSAGSVSAAAGAGGEPANEPCPRVQVHVAAGAKLNVRSEPSTKGTVVTQLEDGAIVDVLGEVKGESINGTDGWFHIQSGNLKGFVFGEYATCTEEKPPVVTQPDGYYLPLACGKSAKIAQGNGGAFSHSGKSYYAFDFSLGLGTPMTAMADGVVKYTYDKTGPGDPCYGGGPSTCFKYANYVVLKHGDGSLTTYKHLNRVDVKLDQSVKRGTVIGLSGSTGYSTGPHAHVMRMNDCGAYQCLSIPLQFQDVPGDHVPNQGQTVTSGNCP